MDPATLIPYESHQSVQFYFFKTAFLFPADSQWTTEPPESCTIQGVWVSWFVEIIEVDVYRVVQPENTLKLNAPGNVDS